MEKSRFASVHLTVYYFTMILCVLMFVVMYLIGEDKENVSLLQDMTSRIVTYLFIIFLIGVYVFAVADVFYAVKLYKNKDLSRLIDGVGKIKLGAIPCHIIMQGFGWLLFASIKTAVYSLAVISYYFYFYEFICIVYFGGQIVMTGAYGIAYVRLSRKLYPENKISGVHYILQILPVLDVLSSICLRSRHRRYMS